MSHSSMSDILKNVDAEKGKLMKEFATTIQKKGFVNAWNKHLTKIVEVYHDRGAFETIMGRELFAEAYRWHFTLPFDHIGGSAPAGRVSTREAAWDAAEEGR